MVFSKFQYTLENSVDTEQNIGIILKNVNINIEKFKCPQ